MRRTAFLVACLCCCSALAQSDAAKRQFSLGNKHLIKGEYDKAISYYNEAIMLDPKYVNVYLNRGGIWGAKREFDKASADFSEVIRLAPRNIDAYSGRGICFYLLGKYEKAIADCGVVIKLDSTQSDAYEMRGECLRLTGKFEEAIADFDKAIALNANAQGAYNARAWILATCPSEKVRDGEQAIRDATLVCKLRDWENARCIRTLAAAHAELGNFAKAVEYQERAIELASDKDKTKWNFDAPLELYKSGKPYREGAQK